MSSITKKTINGSEYTFINTSRGNRSGFVHETELYKGALYLGKNKCQYINRTWERYEYQSVMRGLVYSLVENFKSEYIARWKADNGVKRLTAKKREELEKNFSENKSSLYSELKELYMSLA